jgi:hypothetical protein
VNERLAQEERARRERSSRVCVGGDAGGLALCRPFYLETRDAGLWRGRVKNWRGPDRQVTNPAGATCRVTSVPPTNSEYLHVLGRA